MTDAQINEAVTKSTGGKATSTFGAILIRELGINDYCNDWAYGGLIIQNAKISLIKTDDDCWTAFEWENDENERWHKNPLRAAMIVYLIMNEDKK